MAGSDAALASGRRDYAATATLPALPDTPPAWLPPDAAEVWVATVPMLAGIATEADTETLAAFCLNVATIHANARDAEDLRNPERIELVHAAQIRLERAAAALGLTPAARARIPRQKEKPAPTGLAGLLAGPNE